MLIQFIRFSLLMVALWGSAAAASEVQERKTLAANSKISIAVIEFTAGPGATREEAGALAGRLREILVRNGNYNIINKEQIDTILNEQKLFLKLCSDNECFLKLGKQLAAEQMVTGKISKGEGGYLVTIEHTDVDSVHLLHSLTRTCKCTLGQMFGLMEQVAKNFFLKPIPVESPAKIAFQSPKSPPASTWALRPKVIIVSGVALLLSGGAGVYYFSDQASQDRRSYDDARGQDAIDAAHAKTVSSNQRTLYSGLTIGLGALAIGGGFLDGMLNPKPAAVSLMPSRFMVTWNLP